jgi:hypothetical protein
MSQTMPGGKLTGFTITKVASRPPDPHLRRGQNHHRESERRS